MPYCDYGDYVRGAYYLVFCVEIDQVKVEIHAIHAKSSLTLGAIPSFEENGWKARDAC